MKKVIKEIFYIDDKDIKKIYDWKRKHYANQTTLAMELGISTSYLSSILKGERPITKNVINKFENIGIKLGGN